MKGRQVYIAFLMFAVLLALGLGTQIRAALPYCPHNQTNAAPCERERSKKEHSIFFIVANWASAHHDAIEALSAFATVLLTIGIIISNVALWDAARNTAQFAERAIESTERQNAALNRAFVFVDSFNLSVELIAHAGVARAWKIGPIWRNSGNTPTKRMNCHISFDYFDGDIPPDFQFPDYWDVGADRTPIIILIGPAAQMFGYAITLNVVDLEKVREGKKRLFVWGWGEYDDVFEDSHRHRTEYCHEVLVTGDVADHTKTTLNFRVYSRHNGADSDCMKPVQT